MSYSDVRICTTIKGFELMNNFVAENLDLTSYTNLLTTLDVETKDVALDYIFFGWKMIKWYEFQNKDVIAVMGSLKVLQENDIPYRYIRVDDSNEGDIETMDRDDNDVLPYMYAETNIIYDLPEKNQGDKTDNYFALFSCDEWKSNSSMGLKGIFTREVLNSLISKELSDNNMEFDGESYSHYSELDIRTLNDALTYGYVQELSINEVL